MKIIHKKKIMEGGEFVVNSKNLFATEWYLSNNEVYNLQKTLWFLNFSKTSHKTQTLGNCSFLIMNGLS